MKILKFIWRAIGVGVAIQYGYWGILFAGAWLNMLDPPTISLDWLALGMFGAMFTAAEQAVPSLRSYR